jgi:hypothetical protein
MNAQYFKIYLHSLHPVSSFKILTFLWAAERAKITYRRKETTSKTIVNVQSTDCFAKQMYRKTKLTLYYTERKKKRILTLTLGISIIINKINIV